MVAICLNLLPTLSSKTLPDNPPSADVLKLLKAAVWWLLIVNISKLF
jgi:hypothetical protein